MYVFISTQIRLALILARLTSDFWGYFEPIRQNMPANCSADVEAVIAHVDSLIGSNDTSAISALKATFGLPLGHNDDFAAARTCFLEAMTDIFREAECRGSSTEPLHLAVAAT